MRAYRRSWDVLMSGFAIYSGGSLWRRIYFISSIQSYFNQIIYKSTRDSIFPIRLSAPFSRISNQWDEADGYKTIQ